jgi:hypothetical protein
VKKGNGSKTSSNDSGLNLEAQLWVAADKMRGHKSKDVLGRIYGGNINRRICDVLRSNRSPIVAEVLLPGGTRKVIRGRKEK